MASVPFGGRYRLIDFTLSSMANAGIDNVSVIVRKELPLPDGPSGLPVVSGTWPVSAAA